MIALLLSLLFTPPSHAITPVRIFYLPLWSLVHEDVLIDRGTRQTEGAGCTRYQSTLPGRADLGKGVLHLCPWSIDYVMALVIADFLSLDTRYFGHPVFLQRDDQVLRGFWTPILPLLRESPEGSLSDRAQAVQSLTLRTKIEMIGQMLLLGVTGLDSFWENEAPLQDLFVKPRTAGPELVSFTMTRPRFNRIRSGTTDPVEAGKQWAKDAARALSTIQSLLRDSKFRESPEFFALRRLFKRLRQLPQLFDADSPIRDLVDRWSQAAATEPGVVSSFELNDTGQASSRREATFPSSDEVVTAQSIQAEYRDYVTKFAKAAETGFAHAFDLEIFPERDFLQGLTSEISQKALWTLNNHVMTFSTDHRGGSAELQRLWLSIPDRHSHAINPEAWTTLRAQAKCDARLKPHQTGQKTPEA